MQSTNQPTNLVSSPAIDNKKLRQLFAKTQRTNDSAFLFREISSRMMDRLSFIKLSPQNILDAGCGAGADFSQLRNRFPNSNIYGIDAAANNLKSCCNKVLQKKSFLDKWKQSSIVSSKRGATYPICGDFAQLPFCGSSIDLIWSNLALHWHTDFYHVFKEWIQSLKVDGLLMFSYFGPDTLKQLRSSFLNSDRRVLSFPDMHDVGDMLSAAGFSAPVMDMETLTVTYADVDKLFSDVRALGGNALHSRIGGLTGKVAWQEDVERLEKYRESDGRISLTYEIVYGHAFKVSSKKNSSGQSIIQMDLKRKVNQDTR